MRFDIKLMEIEFNRFKQFVENKSKVPFKDFKYPYIHNEENYKNEIYEQARENLRLNDSQIWKDVNIGKGEIQKRVISAIEIKDNNLLLWDNRYGEERKQHKTLLNAPRNKKDLDFFEKLFFDFYKNKVRDELTFKGLLEYTTDYRLISYLFFIKKKGDDKYMEKDRYLPIVPNTFDKVFDKIGIVHYKAKGNCSFENYKEFIEIVKEVREYLSNKINTPVTILDAHSFLWILGDQMEKAKDKEMQLPNAKNEMSKNEPVSQNDDLAIGAVASAIEEANNDSIVETFLSELRVRRGQQKLRENLLVIYENKCCITGCTIKEILHACHINPHSDCGDNSVSNAFLFRSDIHDLFDSNLLGINPETLTVHLSHRLLNTEYNQLEGKQIVQGLTKVNFNTAGLKCRWNLFKKSCSNPIVTQLC